MPPCASTTSPSDLGDLLLELLRIPSVTGDEVAIADWLASRYADEQVARVRNSLVVGDLSDDSRPMVLLVAHTDTVPATPDDVEPRREADRIVGRGASDMKSGLAVAMDCFEDDALRAGRYNPVLVAYAAEEGAHEANELGQVLAQLPQLRGAALAVVLEPTDLTVQLGCLGVLHAEVTLTGRAAHSARPWHGENALTKAAPLLAELAGRPPRDVVLDDLLFREVLTPTQAWTGGSAGTERARNARNVVPDRFTVNVNYRFAPDRTLVDAEHDLRELFAAQAAVHVVDRAPACPPRRDAPLVQAFIDAARADVEPKQAWTDVARFAELGVPALNYGPGLTGQAHQAGEYVPEENLRLASGALRAFLRG